ncbi:hypothetical protein EG68_10987 [Paragonimus skrjabini miyazakii]|uniref:GMPS ATP-PPase domain-containing protein n=1 Tax=Paragonimus skrjabini miyazakii TaxID=59628 RepID=A0A8S9YFF3_9TREM|nr:hypothetical protein EG68_10987 [Paragonimus skrjabini miyazakii]
MKSRTVDYMATIRKRVGQRKVSALFTVRDLEIWDELELDLETLPLRGSTLQPDLNESVSKQVSLWADTMKTHHDSTVLARHLQKDGLLTQPSANVYKDEVRQIG